MNLKEYFNNVFKTENSDYNEIRERLDNNNVARLLRAATGLSTEANEFLDQLSKHIFYNKKLDKTNLLEELGDMLWYVCVGLDAIGENLETCMESNTKKLFTRYKEKKFTEKEANIRNIDLEIKNIKSSKNV